MAMETFFKGVRQSPLSISSGTFYFPAFYRDASQFGVFFRIDLDRARDLLRDTTVEPWPILGAAMGAIYAWEYRDTDLGPYNEVGIGIQARRCGSHPSLLRFGLDISAQ